MGAGSLLDPGLIENIRKLAVCTGQEGAYADYMGGKRIRENDSFDVKFIKLRRLLMDFSTLWRLPYLLPLAVTEALGKKKTYVPTALKLQLVL